MTQDEEIEYKTLLDKRDLNTLTAKEYKRYKELVDKAFSEGIGKIAKEWMGGFGLEDQKSK